MEKRIDLNSERRVDTDGAAGNIPVGSPVYPGLVGTELEVDVRRYFETVGDQGRA